jgi:hypothetical protein
LLVVRRCFSTRSIAIAPKAKQMNRANSGLPFPPDLSFEVVVAGGVPVGAEVTPRTPCEPDELEVGVAVTTG